MFPAESHLLGPSQVSPPALDGRIAGSSPQCRQSISSSTHGRRNPWLSWGPVGLSLGPKELGKEKGENKHQRRNLSRGMGWGGRLYRTTDSPVHPWAQETDEAAQNGYGCEAKLPNQEPAGHRQYVPLCFDKSACAWGGGVSDRDSGWHMVFKSCPKYGSSDPSIPS